MFRSMKRQKDDNWPGESLAFQAGSVAAVQERLMQLTLVPRLLSQLAAQNQLAGNRLSTLPAARKDYLESIKILEICHYKDQQKLSHHEFIGARMKGQYEGEKWIVLDRDAQGKEDPNVFNRSTETSAKVAGTRAAVDGFNLSYDDKEPSGTPLCRYTLPEDQSRSFIKLVSVANAISTELGNYQLFYRNCYVFAAFVYSLMNYFYPDGHGTTTDDAWRRGRFHRFQINTSVIPHWRAADGTDALDAIKVPKQDKERKLLELANQANDNYRDTLTDMEKRSKGFIRVPSEKNQSSGYSTSALGYEDGNRSPLGYASPSWGQNQLALARGVNPTDPSLPSRTTAAYTSQTPASRTPSYAPSGSNFERLAVGTIMPVSDATFRCGQDPGSPMPFPACLSSLSTTSTSDPYTGFNNPPSPGSAADLSAYEPTESYSFPSNYRLSHTYPSVKPSRGYYKGA